MNDNPFSVFARVVLVIAGFFVIVWCGLRYWEDRSHRARHSREYRASLGITWLGIAVSAYSREFGTVPTGSNAQIHQALLGENPKRIAFSEVAPNEVSRSGEILDPWGMPYQIDTGDPNYVKIYSFGRDKLDHRGEERTDDIVSWR
jgi:hypothetical protein